MMDDDDDVPFVLLTWLIIPLLLCISAVTVYCCSPAFVIGAIGVAEADDEDEVVEVPVLVLLLLLLPLFATKPPPAFGNLPILA